MAMASRSVPRPLHVAHLVFRLDHGGLETILVQLINRLPRQSYRHSVICLTACDGQRGRIEAPGVDFYPLHKRPGKDLAVWWRLWRVLRGLRPDLLHTCNLAAVEGLPVAVLAGVTWRVHVEHGRDSYDLDGSNWRYRWLRRLATLAAHRVVAVSGDLQQWLVERVGVPERKVRLVMNGVDTGLFHPALSLLPRRGVFRVGFVGRLWPVKDPATLVRGVAVWRRRWPGVPLRLEVVGDGPLRGEMVALAAALGVAEFIDWLGWREDVAERLRQWDVLVLPSLAEGTPLTLLEAMASGIPVVASRVGGVAAVVRHGETGLLIPPADPVALAEAMAWYWEHPELRERHGMAGCGWVRENFSLEGMVAAYDRLFREGWGG